MQSKNRMGHRIARNKRTRLPSAKNGGPWEGVVEVVLLLKHPKVKTTCAWTDLSNGSIKSRTVLHFPPVDSPQMAVGTFNSM
jgi:hypothetical protein